MDPKEVSPGVKAARSARHEAAHIAFAASDTIFSLQSTLNNPTGATSLLKILGNEKISSLVSSKPFVQVLRHRADPFASVLEAAQRGEIVSVVTNSTDSLVTAIPYLTQLSAFAAVVHVALPPSSNAYGDIAAVRQTGMVMLQSFAAQETEDMAVIAHALSINSRRGVIHFFEASAQQAEHSSHTAALDTLRGLVSIDAITKCRATESESHLYLKAQRIVQEQKNNADGAHEDTDGVKDVMSGMNGVNGRAKEKEGTNSVNGKTNGVAHSESISSLARKTTQEEVQEQFTAFQNSTGRKYDFFNYSGAANAEYVVLLFGSNGSLYRDAIQSGAEDYKKVGLLTTYVYRPWSQGDLLAKIPKSARCIAILEQVKSSATRWGPLLLDVLSSVHAPESQTKLLLVSNTLGEVEKDTVQQALRGVVQNLRSEEPLQNLYVGRDAKEEHEIMAQPSLEGAYLKLLAQLFGERLHVANSIENSRQGLGSFASSPEYALGSLMGREERRRKFLDTAARLVKDAQFSSQDTTKAVSDWLLHHSNASKVGERSSAAITALETDDSQAAAELLGEKQFFTRPSQWLIASDAWSHDLGNSGVHHLLSSGRNVNMLIIDSQPYSTRAVHDAARRKKDIGLYAMNYGNAYVASTAVYSSYTQVLHAMLEADKYDGPSVILAYLPYHSEDDTALNVLMETKKAVDTGYWPLYRMTPSNSDAGNHFELDSERIKEELRSFLRRDNHISQLVRRQPALAATLESSYGAEVRSLQKRQAREALSRLLEGLSGPPLTILFASDNGNAEGLAKRLQRRGKARGLKATVQAMDDYVFDELPSEQNLVCITSTAGQGEFPQNGRAFWDAIKGSTDLDLSSTNFSVFALGDSHYWPRKQDKHFYNKPGKDLDAKLEVFGGKRMTDAGLGDDQDPDSFQTGYNNWEPQLWTALGVDKVEAATDEPPPITNEGIKIESNFLRGTIAEGLRDESTGAISASDSQLTKFHGTYMQDDRDVRDERKEQGLEPAYSFMVRVRTPAGVCTPQQWLAMDEICDAFGNHTMKLTTRQTFQFHGIIKKDLRNGIRAINKALLDTIAACGDVNRNVMCSPCLDRQTLHREVADVGKKISEYLLPKTGAYHEIWLKDEDDKKSQVAGEAIQDFEPMYGPTYLPRKHKITIAIPPKNDVDVYAHDIGMIAISDNAGNLEGFNFYVGGGMGVTHNNKKTYPRLNSESPIGFATKDKAHLICEQIMLVQRDHGDRKNRKHARMKYTIDDHSTEWYKEQVEKRLGWKLEQPKSYHFDSNIDDFGWIKDDSGKWHFTMFIENGRVQDMHDGSHKFKTGLREIANVHKGEFRLSPNQHLILSNVEESDVPKMKELLSKYGLDNTDFSGLRLSSSACVAFPTCGLAMAESERYLPILISKVENILEEYGLKKDSIVMRMTGCPNGCARPWVAEIAFIGKSYNFYDMLLGGGYHGQRLNKLYRSSINEEQILELLRPLIKQYAVERNESERFGDFVIRAGIIKPTMTGKQFHEDVEIPDEDE